MRLDARAASYLKDYLQVKSSNFEAAKVALGNHTDRALQSAQQGTSTRTGYCPASCKLKLWTLPNFQLYRSQLSHNLKPASASVT